MAAIMAARKGAAVTVLEQNEKPGKKICATGNGRCNFSNLAKPDDAYRGEHPEFAEGALVQFSVEDTIDFFREIGISIREAIRHRVLLMYCVWRLPVWV